MDAWQVPLDHISRHVDHSSLYFCGFPTLKHIKHKVGVSMSKQYSCLCLHIVLGIQGLSLFSLSSFV